MGACGRQKRNGVLVKVWLLVGPLGLQTLIVISPIPGYIIKIDVLGREDKPTLIP